MLAWNRRRFCSRRPTINASLAPLRSPRCICSHTTRSSELNTVGVEQLERAPPMFLSLLVCRRLWDEQRVDEYRLVSGVRVEAQVADVIVVIDEDAVRKNEMHQR